MARPPAPYARARVISTLITSTIWLLLLYLTTAFSNGGRLAHMSPLEMANAASITFMFIPYFATHGVLMSLYNGVIRGTMIAPEATDLNAAPGTENPWQLSVINAFIFGLPPAAIAFYLGISAQPDTVLRGAFAARVALTGALLAGIVTWVASGRAFLRTIKKPREKRGYRGTPEQYLWRYFALPHGSANMFINAALAFVFSPVPFSKPGAIVPTRNIIFDTVITVAVLTLLLAGARSQARNETLLGIAPPAAASKKSIMSAILTVLLCGEAFAIAVAVFFLLTKLPGLDIISWAVYRGVVYGVYAGWLTYEIARAAINKTVNTSEPAPAPGSSVAA